MKDLCYGGYVEVKDNVYGKYLIKEKILIDLINTKSIQRLKKVRQQGLPKEWHHGVEFSRYGHSVGVMILLSRFGATLKERVAGLLHDVSHMAFSHVYDYLVKNTNETSGDDIYYKHLLNDKEIQKILNKYGYSIEDFKDLDRFSLLEREAPDLCADRIDYTLREYEGFKKNKIKLNTIINDFIIVDREIMFKTKKSANEFYKMYDYFQANHWGGIKHMMNYNIFVDVLNRALVLKLIKMSDFYKDDEYILKIIKKSKDPIIVAGINKLATKNFKIPKGKNVFIGKKRVVNPRYVENKSALYLLDNNIKK